MNEIKTFEFDGAEFPVIQNDDLPSGTGIAITTVCNHLGVDPQKQRQRIERRPWSEGKVATTATLVPGDTQPRRYFLLDTSRFAMWMATIDTSRLRNEDAKYRIEMWQNEAADALDTYLREGVAVETVSRHSDEEIRASVERQLEIRMYRQTIRDMINAVDDSHKGDYARIRNAIYTWLTGKNAEGLRTSGRAIQQWKGKNGPTQTDLKNASNYLTVKERTKMNALLKISNGISDARPIESINDIEEILTESSKVLDRFDS